MLFQGPMLSGNFAFTAVEQVAEVLGLHECLGDSAAFDRAVALLGCVRVPEAARRAGQYPHQGSGGMSRGHVAVVRHVVGPREVRIDHANWGGPGIRRGSVMQDVSVIDVSATNDWSEVRVQSGTNDNAFGRVYPTYGFIYNRPDDGVNTGTAYAGMQLHRSTRYEQLAEMPDGQASRGYSLQGLAPLRTAQARTTR